VEAVGQLRALGGGGGGEGVVVVLSEVERKWRQRGKGKREFAIDMVGSHWSSTTVALSCRNGAITAGELAGGRWERDREEEYE